MREINRVKRRKTSVAVVVAAIGGVAIGGNVATANENGGFWPRLGASAIPTAEFDGNAGFAGATMLDGANDSATAEPKRVESANFAGYSVVPSDLLERTDAANGRTRLVGWTEPDAAPSSALQSLETSTANEPPAPVPTSSEDDKTAGISENKKNGETASERKTPILRDEPTSTARGGSWASALVSTFGALAVVLGAFFALVAFLKRTNPKNGGVGSALEIVDSLAVGDKARLLTIRWGNRLILAAKTPEKIAPLAEIADVDEASALLAEIERRKEAAATGDVGAKAAAIWKRSVDAANAWRTTRGTKGRRQ